MEYIENLIFAHFIPTAVSTLSVFCLTFILMYIHYLVRKNFYQGALCTVQTNLLGVKKKLELLDEQKKKLIANNADKKEITLKEEEIAEQKKQKVKLEGDNYHIQNYCFRRYIIDILDRKYADLYEQRKK